LTMDETNTTASEYLELQSAAATAAVAAEEEAAGRDLRTSLQFSIIQICAQQDRMNQTRTSSQAIKALTELTFQFATTSLSQDLDAFSSHANRKRITLDDVKLVLRKSSENLARLQDYCEQELLLLVGGPQQQQQQHSGVVESNNGNIKDGRISRVKNYNASTTTMTTSAMSDTKRRTGTSGHGASKRPPRQFDLTSPKVDDSSSSDESVFLQRESFGITKISSGATSKKIDTNTSDSDDDDIVLPSRTNFREGKTVVVRGAQKKRILESSRSDDDDDDCDIQRGIRRQKSNQNAISQKRRHELAEPGKFGHSSTQTMRIMAEMSPHSAASDDESYVDKDDDMDENKDNNTRKSTNLCGTTVKEPTIESSSSTEEEETEFN
jgi:histone H3/H4